MRTALTERFDLTVPVVGAPMAGAAGGDLAAAISAAGGLGMIGAAFIYAGQSVGLVRQPRPAAEVVAELATADDLLRRASSPA